jgi:hypothetical protein
MGEEFLSMTDIFQRVHRANRFRAASLLSALLLVSACNDDLPSTPAPSPGDPVGFAASTANAPAAGILFGAFGVTNPVLGAPYQGAVRQPGPTDILPLLTDARAKGGRLFLQLTSDKSVLNADRSFSFEKWKAQVDRFKQVDLQPFISSGTLVGHYLITEPEDAGNWGGRKIPPATVEAMAKYSKQLWPTLTTFAHSRPTYLVGSGTKFQYLDAGWAMYHSWNGDISGWLKSEVAAAKKAGIGLVVGLNVLDGGSRGSGIPGYSKGADRYGMNASQLKSWGSTLLAESYVCGFINWKYDAGYNGRADIRSAMASLSQGAQAHARTSCRSGEAVVNVPAPDDPPNPDPDPEEPAQPEQPVPPSSSGRSIAFGQFRLPNSLLSSIYTGAYRLPGPGDVMGTLASAQAHGGAILIQFSNADKYVKNSDGTFNLSKWKAQVARFKGMNFNAYISDGTLIGHYMLDEPDDPTNWGGKRIPPSVVEEMARYSKQLWPGMTTFIRSKPSYMVSTGTRFTYLDAAWAMYESWQRPTDVSAWLRGEVGIAKQAGLGLMVGLNVLDGGTRESGIRGFTSSMGRYAMSANQVRSWGSTLLNEPYVCGFFNFAYSSSYYGRSDIKSAMQDLSRKTKSHPKTSCRQR